MGSQSLRRWTQTPQEIPLRQTRHQAQRHGDEVLWRAQCPAQNGKVRQARESRGQPCRIMSSALTASGRMPMAKPNVPAVAMNGRLLFQSEPSSSNARNAIRSKAITVTNSCEAIRFGNATVVTMFSAYRQRASIAPIAELGQTVSSSQVQ